MPFQKNKNNRLALTSNINLSRNYFVPSILYTRRFLEIFLHHFCVSYFLSGLIGFIAILFLQNITFHFVFCTSLPLYLSYSGLLFVCNVSDCRTTVYYYFTIIMWTALRGQIQQHIQYQQKNGNWCKIYL